MPASPLDLVRSELVTLFTLDERGRIVSENEPTPAPGARMYVAGCTDGNVFAVHRDVADDVAREIEHLVADEAPLAEPDARPRHAEAYAALLSNERQARPGGGVSFVVHRAPDVPTDVDLVRSGSRAGDALLERIAADGMPARLRALRYTELWDPWCVAVVDGEPVAVAETVRRSPAGVEAGVATVPEFRRRGLASAVTAAWSNHPDLAGVTRFYSTDQDNVASQRVARGLGLQYVGASFRVD